MRKLLIPALAAGAILLASALPGLADSNLPNIPAHRHFIETPGGKLVEVGPRVCDDATLQEAFNQFHSNVHHAVSGSEGPAVSAPGLHNGHGAELRATGC